MKNTIKYRLTIDVEVIDDSVAHRELIDLAMSIDDGTAKNDLMTGVFDGLINAELSLIKIEDNGDNI